MSAALRTRIPLRCSTPLDCFYPAKFRCRAAHHPQYPRLAPQARTQFDAFSLLQ
jgi:hypothetical protein